MNALHRYRYDGIVMEFNNVVSWRWVGETVAPTARKAKSNLKYQYKMKYGKTRDSKIELPGKIEVVV